MFLPWWGPMKKNLKLIIPICIVLLIAIALLVSKWPGLTRSPSLSVHVTPKPAGPQVTARDPVVGQRLPLSPAIQVTFDQAMDQAKTGSAFAFTDSSGKAVPGK